MAFPPSYREQTLIPLDRSGEAVSRRARGATTSRASLSCVHWPFRSHYHRCNVTSLDRRVPSPSSLPMNAFLRFSLRAQQGVLNIVVSDRGTWVINKQSPNQQIWWSSPIRYPFVFFWYLFLFCFYSRSAGTYVVARIGCLGRAAGAVRTRTKWPCPLRWRYIYCQYVYKYNTATVWLGLRMARAFETVVSAAP